jgi:hypothetical protein
MIQRRRMRGNERRSVRLSVRLTGRCLLQSLLFDGYEVGQCFAFVHVQYIEKWIHTQRVIFCLEILIFAFKFSPDVGSPKSGQTWEYTINSAA